LGRAQVERFQPHLGQSFSILVNAGTSEDAQIDGVVEHESGGERELPWQLVAMEKD
jgi:hypothetical protein